MGLSRLDNFLRSAKGTILYVDPNSLDATDGVENRGNSLTRPFKTIQRALIEAARFSYQRGFNNDRFNKTTILLYPGDHFIDNRPGYIPIDGTSFKKRGGSLANDLTEWNLLTNYDLTNPDNTLYKLNSIHGGVIVPRGTSIVGMDLRKTKIRPLYVPNPENDNIERSAVFRVTGGCYFWQFTVLDSDPNGNCYKDYTSNLFVPNFSHHKLACFEYADGTNGVDINDEFLNGANAIKTDRTDLDMYYEKVGIVYGSSSNREIGNDFPSPNIDIEPTVDEYRIVGSRGASVGITSITSNNSTTITATLSQPFPQLSVDTPIQITGVDDSAYNGQFVVSSINDDLTQVQYKVQNIPSNQNPNAAGATLVLVVDTVNSASPYIFNCSLRSVYGMCGMLADGNKASGFKSMVVAQFTGIGLQKDDRAFVKYDSSSGDYRDYTIFSNLHTNSLSRFKPSYENFHIKATNDAFIQVVSVFAIGYAQHFIAENGGDLSITNSNSNFGARSLVSSGYRSESFPRDDIGYISHIITPKEIDEDEITVEYGAIDIQQTIGVGNSNRIYLYNETNRAIPPQSVIDGYRIGAKPDDELFVEISENNITEEYSAKIIMPDTQNTLNPISYEKKATVAQNSIGINSIGTLGEVNDNVIVLTGPHDFINGETVRVLSENAHLPDGVTFNQIYHVITSGSGITTNNYIKLAQTLNDAIQDTPIELNYKGGILHIISYISDKKSGDIGHPIQYDSVNGQWYANVSSASTENTIYSKIVGLGVTVLGNATSRTFFKRTIDSRSLNDKIYRVRYVIPRNTPPSNVARPPLDGFIIQESNNTAGSGTTEISKFLSSSTQDLVYSNELRNFRFISGANWSSNTANIYTELPHNLKVGTKVEVINIRSSQNTSGVGNSGYNGTYEVSGITSSKHFSYSLTTNPGTFQNDVSSRTSSLPSFKKKSLPGTYQIYRTQEIKKYIPQLQDGVYHLIVTNSSNSPTLEPFTNLKFSQPIQYLYPQNNRDYPVSDPKSTKSFALPDPIGQVVIDNVKNSLTKETIENSFFDFGVGIAITDIVSTSETTHTLYTKVDHRLSGISSASVLDGGSGYSPGVYFNSKLVSYNDATGSHATARVTVSAGGTINEIKIIDGGSAYGVGNTVSVIGVGTIGSGAVATITRINPGIGKVLSISGVSSTSYDKYNTLYRVSGITTGKDKEISVVSSTEVSTYSAVGLGLTITQNANAYLTGEIETPFTFTFTPSTGVGAFTFVFPKDFKVNEKIRVSGATDNYFNKDFIIESVVGNGTTITFNAGITTLNPATTGTIAIYKHGLTSYGGDINASNENLSSRIVIPYAGITTSINVGIAASDPDNTNLIIPNADELGLYLGDFLQVDNEIFRIRSTVTNSSVAVFRGELGTNREDHEPGSVVKKVKPIPVELRRNSIIRASAHTFEYLGFGPGNYSTALPERQDRVLSNQEELLSQSLKNDGGICIFTAMNSDGDFYTGNKKINSSTGQEEVYDSPIPTTTGDDLDDKSVSAGLDLLSPSEISVSRSIRVEGGSDKSIISQFDSPVVFNNKIISNSPKGIEAQSLFIQGDATISRKYTVGISTPTLAGTNGDVVYKSNPESGGYLGWVYASDNKWKRFGAISTDTNSLNPIFDIARANRFIGTFTGDGSGLVNVDSIWIRDAVGVSTISNVGVATTSARSDYKLYVNGDALVDGTMKVVQVIEKATISAGILTATTTNIDLSTNNVWFFTNQAQGNWTLNFRGSSTTTLNNFLNTGDSITVAILTNQGPTPYYNANVQIDGVNVNPRYYGGTTITSGNANSIDLYTYVIIKTGSGAFTVLYSQSQYT
jgi:hypothetical protein